MDSKLVGVLVMAGVAAFTIVRMRHDRWSAGKILLYGLAFALAALWFGIEWAFALVVIELFVQWIIFLMKDEIAEIAKMTLQDKAKGVVALGYWILMALAFPHFGHNYPVTFIILCWAGFAVLIYAFEGAKRDTDKK